jgi:hypothetical protein
MNALKLPAERSSALNFGVLTMLTTFFLARWATAAIGEVSQPNDAALGKVNFTISCSAPAQEEFNRAVALVHRMTYPRAGETFELAQAFVDGKK